MYLMDQYDDVWNRTRFILGFFVHVAEELQLENWPRMLDAFSHLLHFTLDVWCRSPKICCLWTFEEREEIFVVHQHSNVISRINTIESVQDERHWNRMMRLEAFKSQYIRPWIPIPVTPKKVPILHWEIFCAVIILCFTATLEFE
jgi:hypothetical protein